MRFRLIALACLAATSPALSQEFKGPVAGQWRSILDGDTSKPSDQCIEKQESLADFLDGDDTIDAGITCADFKFRREGQTIVGTYVCTDKDSGMKMASSVTLTGDMSSKYTSQIITRFSPPPAPGYETVTAKATSTRIGACR
jgi:hypothetical protein